ncbi:MAG: endonuclease, partial [Bacteroidaceae bacterium]|nr:endonuclease [Bacteroidaceae bacterium]
MNRAFALFFALLFTATAATAQETLRIMSYNIRNCRGIDNILDIQRTAEVIKKSNANIIAILEVDSATRRSNGIFIADTLATLCNMQNYFSAAI